MKTIYKVFICAAALLSLASCNNKMEYKKVPFVVLSSKTANVKEDAGKVTVDVVASNLTGPCTVAYTLSGDAVAGKHYNFSDKSGVIQFDESGKKTLQFDIINHPNEYLGNAGLKLELKEASDGVEIGPVKTFSMTILDNDIPVDWAFVEGTWTAQDLDNGAPDGDPYKAQFKKIDDTTVALINLWGGGNAIQGTIAFDAATNSATMSFPARQLVMDATAYGYGNLLIIGFDNGWGTSIPAQAVVTAAGIELGPWNMFYVQGTSAYLWAGSYTTVFTK